MPDLQTESCSAVIWPGCLSAHTSAPGYQSRSISLLKQLPTGTVPGTLSNQKKGSFIIQAHLHLRPEKWKQVLSVAIEEILTHSQRNIPLPHTSPEHRQAHRPTTSVPQHKREGGNTKWHRVFYFLWKLVSSAICTGGGNSTRDLIYNNSHLNTQSKKVAAKGFWKRTGQIKTIWLVLKRYYLESFFSFS